MTPILCKKNISSRAIAHTIIALKYLTLTILFCKRAFVNGIVLTKALLLVMPQKCYYKLYVYHYLEE